jgi:hypothetical protein
MFVSNLCVRTRRILAQIDWKEVGLIVFHGLIALMVGTYVAGETLGNWVHSTNDKLAANWVRLIVVPPTPAEEQAPLPGITEEVSVPTPPTVVEVEPLLPPVAEVVEISTLQEQPPPVRRRRRSSAQRSLEETVNEEVEPPITRRPRGRRAHKNRNKQAAA